MCTWLVCVCTFMCLTFSCVHVLCVYTRLMCIHILSCIHILCVHVLSCVHILTVCMCIRVCTYILSCVHTFQCVHVCTHFVCTCSAVCACSVACADVNMLVCTCFVVCVHCVVCMCMFCVHTRFVMCIHSVKWCVHILCVCAHFVMCVHILLCVCPLSSSLRRGSDVGQQWAPQISILLLNMVSTNRNQVSWSSSQSQDWSRNKIGGGRHHKFRSTDIFTDQEKRQKDLEAPSAKPGKSECQNQQDPHRKPMLQ